MVSRLAMAYFGGAVAALVTSLLLWAVAQAGLLELIGVGLAPSLRWSWLAPRLLWGSLFALAYPLVRRRGFTPVRSGLILSVLPSVVELFIVLPNGPHGLLGLSLGHLTPLVVLATNAVWGWGLARIMIAKGHS
ncbi:MAG: hypothetical protein ACE5FG_11450 [Myxococcota bacterium]